MPVQREMQPGIFHGVIEIIFTLDGGIVKKTKTRFIAGFCFWLFKKICG